MAKQPKKKKGITLAERKRNAIIVFAASLGVLIYAVYALLTMK